VTGDANWLCLDCRTEIGSVVTLAGENGFYEQGHDLRSWFTAWPSGADLWEEMFEREGRPSEVRRARPKLTECFLAALCGTSRMPAQFGAEIRPKGNHGRVSATRQSLWSTHCHGLEKC
jgi:hypothetical protein